MPPTMARELGQQARDVTQSEEKVTVELRVSRQDYMDVKHAWEYCRQNDKIKPLTLRLGKLSEDIREALDKIDAPR